MTVAAVAVLAIALVWVGYPLLIHAIALTRAPLTPAAGPPTSVTVVIATRDDPAIVQRRVDDVLRADYPAALLTVVVGIDARGGRTTVADVDPRGGRVTAVLGDPPGGKAATLNAAVRAATGDVLVFTDAGQTFDPPCIRRLAAAVSVPAIGAASGRLEIPAGADGPSLAERYWRYERWLRRSEARVHSTVGVTGAVYAMRRRLWAPLPPGLILDDLFVPMRLVLGGHRIAFVDDALASDTRRFDASQEFRRKARTLTGVMQLCAWLPAVLVPWRDPIWAQFVMHKLMRLLTPYLLLVAVGGALGALLVAVRGEPRLAAVTLAVGAAAAGAVALHPRLRRRTRAAVEQAVAMQLAVVVATLNGARGRWDVWGR